MEKSMGDRSSQGWNANGASDYVDGAGAVGATQARVHGGSGTTAAPVRRDYMPTNTKLSTREIGAGGGREQVPPPAAAAAVADGCGEKFAAATTRDGLESISGTGHHAADERGGNLRDHESRHLTPWYKQQHLLRLNLLILSILQLSSTNGYDGSLLNSLQALPQWQTFMNRPTGAWLGFVIAVQSIGQLTMYPVCSWLVQRHGRKAGVYLGYFWLVIGIAVQTSAQAVAAFIIARFFIGAATAMWFGSVPLLITEIAHPSHRGVCTSLWNCGWFCGTIVAAWVTYGTRNYEGDWAWRLPSLLQFVLPCVALPGVVFLPESPRWLVARGRAEEAREVLFKWHAGGDVGSRVAEIETREIEEALKRERAGPGENGFARGYLELFQGKGNRWRSFITITLGFLAQFNGVGVVQYYLVLVLETVGITGVTEQTLISGFLQVWNLICAVTGALLVNRMGRKWLFNLSNVTMLVCFVLITALSATFATQANSAAGIAVIPFLFLYYGAYDIAWNPLIFAYTVEIWPYRLRAKGLSLCMISTAFALLFNIFVNPIALGSIGWRYYIVYVVTLLATTLICWLFYPETRGHTLEQMAVIFDGDKADSTAGQETGTSQTDARFKT